MAEFLYFTGPMGCGKSTLALQLDYNQSAGGRRGRLFTTRDRAGNATITSRLGLARPAIEVGAQFDFWTFVVGELTAGERIDYLVCDESQFYLPDQVDGLARVVDELGIDVYVVGIMTDFRTRLFPGAQRLVELCDRVELLQVRALCWCGARATHNARTVGGVLVTEGAQVMVGDTTPVGDESEVGDEAEVGDAVESVAYEVLCRRHHRLGLTRAAAHAGLEEPLPFERSEDEQVYG